MRIVSVASITMQVVVTTGENQNLNKTHNGAHLRALLVACMAVIFSISISMHVCAMYRQLMINV